MALQDLRVALERTEIWKGAEARLEIGGHAIDYFVEKKLAEIR